MTIKDLRNLATGTKVAINVLEFNETYYCEITEDGIQDIAYCTWNDDQQNKLIKADDFESFEEVEESWSEDLDIELLVGKEYESVLNDLASLRG